MKIFKPKRRMNRKGALELSINAVVILILAITMLGLGLGFIRGLFGGTVEKFAEIGEQLEEEQRTTLLESASEVTFLTSNIKVKGREKSVSFAIRNNRPNDLTFAVKSGMTCFDAIGSGADPSHITFETYETRTIEGGKSDVLPLVISVNAAAEATTYSCRLVLVTGAAPDPDDPDATPTGEVYATKNFEVEYVK